MNYSRKHNTLPVLLVVLDGWGIAPSTPTNAIAMARTPTFDRLVKTYPTTRLEASGTGVGLFDHIVGNSEVGHVNLGAGRIVEQDIVIINNAIADGSFFQNPILVHAIEHAKNNRKKLHLLGMLSDAGVHSYLPHLFALLELAKRHDFKDVYVHGFTDGRDAPPTSAISFIEIVQKKMKELQVGKLASLAGRFYAMDRIHQWERPAELYHTMVQGKNVFHGTPEQYIRQCYEKGITDEFIPPASFSDDHVAIGGVENGDSLVFWHLRSDRARQLTKAFVKKDFTEFSRGSALENLYFVAFTDFGDDLEVKTAFETRPTPNNVTKVLSDQGGLTQLFVAESEKYSHVSYFFHGNSIERLPREELIKIDSPQVKYYVKTPRMSAEKITRVVVEDIESKFQDRRDFTMINFSNADMIGHTGDLHATIRACEYIDKQLKVLARTIEKFGGHMIITADHGNAEEMMDLQTHEPSTSHTANPVPLILFSTDPRFQKERIRLKAGVLGNVAPTLLSLMKIQKPPEMTQNSLIMEL